MFARILFWSDWGAVRPHIGKAYMDGSNREDIVTRDLGWVNDISWDIGGK